MQRRITYLVAAYSLALLFILYFGLKPNLPKVTHINAGIIHELTSQVRDSYPDVEKIDGELFNNTLKVNVVSNGYLDDRKSGSILKIVKSYVELHIIGKSKFNGITLVINNKSILYRYSAIMPSNNVVIESKLWNVEKTEFIDNKQIMSKSIFEE